MIFPMRRFSEGMKGIHQYFLGQDHLTIKGERSLDSRYQIVEIDSIQRGHLRRHGFGLQVFSMFPQHFLLRPLA